MFEIIPGILEKDWEAIAKKIEIVKPFAKAIHIDILDSKLFPNTTFLDPAPFKKYSADIFFELHMMVEEPIQYLKSFAEAGFRRFIGHVEEMSDQAEFVVKAKSLGEVGLAIDGPTSLESIKVPFSDLDCVLIMTIKAGFSGQAFNLEHLEKVRVLRSAPNNIKIPIEIDGGINEQTILPAKAAGANRFVSTSSIFGAPNPEEQFNLLKKIVAPA